MQNAQIMRTNGAVLHEISSVVHDATRDASYALDPPARSAVERIGLN